MGTGAEESIPSKDKIVQCLKLGFRELLLRLMVQITGMGNKAHEFEPVWILGIRNKKFKFREQDDFSAQKKKEQGNSKTF